MLADGVKCTTSTTGTTAALVVAAVTGYPQPSDFLTDGDVVSYNLADGSATPQLEWGIGTWSASAGTITRSYVAQTYSGGVLSKGASVSPLNLAGTSTLIITPITGTQTPGRRATVASGMVSGNPHLAAAFPDGYVQPQGGTATANTIYLSEYQHKSHRAIKGFRAFVGTSSGNINFALYRVNADGSVGKQLCTTGAKATVSGLNAYALAAPLWLPPDSYICAVQVDNASASFRMTYGCGSTFFGTDASGNSVAFMTAAPGAFALPSTWSGALSPVGSSNGGPAVWMELQ